MRRRIVIALASIAALLVVAMILVLVVTNTDWGRERVRRYAQKAIQGAAHHGIVRIGGLEGNLLTGFTLRDVSITDSAKAPFVTAERASVRYALRDLYRRKLIFRDVRMVRPVIILAQNDSGAWNYAEIFASGEPPTPADTNPHFGSWIAFENVTLTDGRVTVRARWRPPTSLSAAARDSVIHVALDDSSDYRFAVVRVGEGSYRRVSDFRDLTGHFPLIRVADPDSTGRIEIDSLRMTAQPFRPPVVQVVDAAGAMEFDGDSLWWRGINARLASSTLSASGVYGFVGNHVALELHGAPVALADVRFVEPRLPSSGSGSLDFWMRWTDSTESYVARDADLYIPRGSGSSALPETRLAGDFGITFFTDGDTLRFHDVDARIENLDVALAEQIFPWLTFPWRGTVGGTAKVSGPMHALALDADLTLDEPRSGRNRLAAAGTLGWDAVRKVLTARDLRVRASPVRVGLARAFTPSVPIGGAVRGTATLDGSTATTMRATFDLAHDDAGRVSRVRGRGAVRLADRTPWIDFDGRFAPLSLAEVGSMAPAAGLRGSASGPVRATGTLDRVRVDATLAVTGGGNVEARGTLDLASKEKGYDLDTRMVLFDANAVVAKAPRTSITATAFARGRGFTPATMSAELGAELTASSFDTVAVDTAHVHATIASGLATVDSALVGIGGARAIVNGTFGLAAGRSGEVAYRVRVDSLHTLARFLPKADTSPVPPRPRIAAERLARARRDSAAAAARGAVARAAIEGIDVSRRARSRVKVQVDTPTALRADSLSGSASASGTIRGWLEDFDVRGSLTGANIVALGNTARDIRAEYAWLHAPHAGSAMTADATLRAVSAKGFVLDSATVHGTYRDKQGEVAIRVMQESGRHYAMKGDYVLLTKRSELRLSDLTLQFDTTRWVARRPSAISWGGAGIEVDTLDLTDGAAGRLYVNGRYASDAPSHLDVAIDNLQVGDVSALLQSDLQARGLVSLRATLEGPATAPRLRGAIGMLEGSYGGAPLPDARGTFRYADARLVAHAEATQRTDTIHTRLVTADASVPLILASGATGARLPRSEPIDLHIEGDSLPLGLVSRFTDIVADVDGRAVGDVRVRGTIDKPAIAGAVQLADGTVRLVPAGVVLRRVAASIRIAGDTVLVDSVVAMSGGRLSMHGGLGIAKIAEPSFDLALVADNARVLDNETGLVRADADIKVRGPYDRVAVTGRAEVRSGVIYLPESNGKEVISATDPALFSVVDTTRLENRELLPSESPLIANLNVNVTLRVDRDMWVRSKDANVEIFTPPDEDLLVRINRRRQRLSLEGAVSTDRGEYQFMSRRFQIRQGSAAFIGGAGIDPTLQITAENEVKGVSSQALIIRVVIGGTLSAPRLSLESTAQPPLSQSDLLSLLAFGRNSSSLLQFGGSSIGGSSGGSGGVASAGATFLGQQLAAVALGVLVDQFEGQASRSIGADVFNITPADVSVEVLRGGSDLSGFLKATEIEAGKYVNPNTYIAIDARPSIFASNPSDRAVPGLTVQRRSGKGFRIEASYQPRFLLKQPTLEMQETRSTGVLGLFLIREWRF